jgi:hypothetical protein
MFLNGLKIRKIQTLMHYATNKNFLIHTTFYVRLPNVWYIFLGHTLGGQSMLYWHGVTLHALPPKVAGITR